MAHFKKHFLRKGRGGGLVVSVLASYSNDPSSIPAEVYNFFCKLLLKRTKINKKRPGLAHLKKKTFSKENPSHTLAQLWYGTVVAALP